MPAVLCMMLKSNDCTCKILSFLNVFSNCISCSSNNLGLPTISQVPQNIPPKKLTVSFCQKLCHHIICNKNQPVLIVFLADFQSALNHCEILIAATNPRLLILNRLTLRTHINVEKGPRHFRNKWNYTVGLVS